MLQQASLRLPDRAPVDSWSDAEVLLQAQTREDVRLACSAQHIRDFHWQVQFQNQHWTQVLVPALVTFYIGPDREPHWILINGQNGHTSGEKHANFDRAALTSAGILGVGGVLIVLATVLALLPLGSGVDALGFIALVLGGIIALAAIFPVAVAYNFNRNAPPDAGKRGALG
ncbi:MAG: hypothetical protein HC915_19285 [Anaerolineae bacterium]|nr:hypothetical protein [Anaerolineae bacterium]